MGPATPLCYDLVWCFGPSSSCPCQDVCCLLSLSVFLLSSLRCWGNPNFPQFGFPLVFSWPRSRSSTRTPSTPFSSRSPPRVFSSRFCLVPAGSVSKVVVVGRWWWGCLFRSFCFALLHLVGLLGKLHEACVPAKPPAPAHLCPSTCPFARLLLGVDRGTCWGKGGWGDRGFCDPATIELRVGVIIAIVVQPGSVFRELGSCIFLFFLRSMCSGFFRPSVFCFFWVPFASLRRTKCCPFFWGAFCQ